MEREPVSQPGAQTMKTLTLQSNEGEGCRLSMALARPWIWSGFTEDGEIIDEATAL